MFLLYIKCSFATHGLSKENILKLTKRSALIYTFSRSKYCVKTNNKRCIVLIVDMLNFPTIDVLNIITVFVVYYFHTSDIVFNTV